MPNNLTSIANAKASKAAQIAAAQRNISSAAANAANTPFALPRFDEFARRNPFVGAKLGAPHVLTTGNWMQEFEHATAYGPPGALATEIHEVHGAIRERYKSFGGPDGFLGLPLTNESGLSDGEGRYNHFQRGSIFWHPTTGAREVHGEIRNHWESLGWERSWLGYPISDEMSLLDQEDGRISMFQNGAIYWWPDVGARALNDVVVQYTGLHCFGATDFDEFSGDDEPYATFGVVGPDNVHGMIQTRVYTAIVAGSGVFDVIDLYRGKPRGLAISSLLQEHSGDKDQLNLSRKATQDAVDSAGPLIEKAASAVPYVGRVLGPLSGAAWEFFKKDIVDALNSFVEQTLGFADRPLGSDLITLTPQQLVLLATRPEGHEMFGDIPWRFETQLLARQGASYKLYFNIFPA
jgi:hypothetical protein